MPGSFRFPLGVRFAHHDHLRRSLEIILPAGIEPRLALQQDIKSS
jgi:hypothetical protein